MGEERRQHPRLRIQGRAEVQFANWTVFKLLYTVNISKGGMNIEMHERPEIGANLRLRLVLPHGWPLDIKAVVRHVTALDSMLGDMRPRYHVGVEFEDLDQAKRTLIEDTIKKHT